MTQETYRCTERGSILRHAALSHPVDGGQALVSAATVRYGVLCGVVGLVR